MDSVGQLEYRLIDTLLNIAYLSTNKIYSSVTNEQSNNIYKRINPLSGNKSIKNGTDFFFAEFVNLCTG